MKMSELIAVALLILIGAEAQAQVTTGVTIDRVKVVAIKDRWQITATGKISLAAGDTLTSYQFLFNDPQKREYAPYYQPPFTPPQPGKSSTYSCVWTTDVQGAWSFRVRMTYEKGGKERPEISKSQKFKVSSEQLANK